MKKFVQIIIQEKCVGDWRAFCSAEDAKGDIWELRGYGNTPAEAADDVYKRFQQPEEDWSCFGYIVTPG